MWESLIQEAATNGLWALLFVSLLVFLLTGSRKRENKYQEVISRLASSLQAVEEIKEDIKEIKGSLDSHLNADKKEGV